MSKQHPIRKMADRAEKCDTLLGVERSLARSVKPLLDELERGIRIYYPAGPNQRKASDLLAAWKEPIK